LLISSKSGIPTFVKIGGCEAKRDIDFCLSHGVSGVVAPMVESSFAVSKFINSVEDMVHEYDIPRPKVYVNIETVAACKNIEEILANHAHDLTGVIVGRSDLSMSMGLSKSNVEDNVVTNLVGDVFECAKSYDLETSMGGCISRNSIPTIEKLYNASLLDKFQTRTLIFSLGSVKDLSYVIGEALGYEQILLKYRLEDHYRLSSALNDRIQSIEKRK